MKLLLSITWIVDGDDDDSWGYRGTIDNVFTSSLTAVGNSFQING